MTPAGFPHSDIHGSRPACGSPRLIAACYVLPRLSAPRHPPCALTALDQIPSRIQSTSQQYNTPTSSPIQRSLILLSFPHPNFQITVALEALKYPACSFHAELGSLTGIDLAVNCASSVLNVGAATDSDCGAPRRDCLACSAMTGSAALNGARCAALNGAQSNSKEH